MRDEGYNGESVSPQAENDVPDRVALAVDALELGTWSLDIASGQVDATPQTYQLFGLNPGTVEGSHDLFMRQVHPADRPGVEEWLSRSKQMRTRTALVFRVDHPDGRIHWIRSRGRRRPRRARKADPHGRRLRGRIGRSATPTTQTGGCLVIRRGHIIFDPPGRARARPRRGHPEADCPVGQPEMAAVDEEEQPANRAGGPDRVSPEGVEVAHRFRVLGGGRGHEQLSRVSAGAADEGDLDRRAAG